MYIERGCGGEMWVYVVECWTPNHYYVGTTENYRHRYKNLARPRHTKGTTFVRTHGFKRMWPVAQTTERGAKWAKELTIKRLRHEGKIVGGAPTKIKTLDNTRPLPLQSPPC